MSFLGKEVLYSTASSKLLIFVNYVHSLLPAPLHFGVAKICIEKEASLVTASYVSKEMMNLHER